MMVDWSYPGSGGEAHSTPDTCLQIQRSALVEYERWKCIVDPVGKPTFVGVACCDGCCSNCLRQPCTLVGGYAQFACIVGGREHGCVPGRIELVYRILRHPARCGLSEQQLWLRMLMTTSYPMLGWGDQLPYHLDPLVWWSLWEQRLHPAMAGFQGKECPNIGRGIRR